MNMGPERTKNWVLAHGCAIGQKGTPIEGLQFGHCWLEETTYKKIPKGSKFPHRTFSWEIVHDYSLSKKGLHIPLALYYWTGKINEFLVKKYTFEQFSIKILKERTWGPWKSDPKCKY